MILRATVISDASFWNGTSNKYRKKGTVKAHAGWAAWISMDNLEKPIRAYGALTKGLCNNSTEAEMYAALNGIWIAAQNGAQEILVRSDCMTVTHAIRGELQSPALLKLWWGALQQHDLMGIKLTAKHVKGHGEIKDRATWVNNWVDEKSRYAQQESRKGNKCLTIS